MKLPERDIIDKNDRKRGPGLYVHIPYCRRKCIYCDFYSGGASTADWQRLVDALVCELEMRRHELYGQNETEAVRHIDTLYIGGGTPSMMPEKEFRYLVSRINDISDGLKGAREITVEANPEDVTPEKAGFWRELGINRLSIGIQTFNDTELKAIGRLHDCEASRRAIRNAMSAFDNISIDLMFGLPGQTIDSWKNTVAEALEWKPQHISAYCLMYEDRTALTALRNYGKITEAEEETVVEMYGILTDSLRSGGYEHYEISNYSLPGRKSLHNDSYWHGVRYLGIGPSAHSYDGVRTRRWNPLDLKGYLSNYAGDSPATLYEEEILTDDELREEMILTRLRTSGGLDLEEFERKFGTEATEKLLGSAGRFIKDNSLESAGNRLRLSEKGIMVSDDIIVSLL